VIIDYQKFGINLLEVYNFKWVEFVIKVDCWAGNLSLNQQIIVLRASTA